MKFLIVAFVLSYLNIHNVVNSVAIITPRTVHTITFYPTTVRSTDETSSSEYSTDSTRFPIFTSTFFPWWTTTARSDWIRQKSTSDTIRRIFLCVFIAFLLGKFVQLVFRSKTTKKIQKNDNSKMLYNKMHISTINIQREDPPPKYADIHHV